MDIWVFVRKHNEKNKIVKYEARLVTQDFSQRLGIDYEETYSPVKDAITLCFLINLAVTENLDMRLIKVVTTLDSDIYMRISKKIKMPEANYPKSHGIYSIKLK